MVSALLFHCFHSVQPTNINERFLFAILDYYQWVSLVLALQAIMCYAPSLFWETLTFNRIGSNLTYYIEAAQAASRDTGASRKDKIRTLASSLDLLIFSRREIIYGPKGSIIYRLAQKIRDYLPNKRLGRALCAYYFVVKFLYLANAVLQIIIMEKFLDMKGDYRLFGIKILEDLFNGRRWQETLVFPRTGYCRVPIKLVGSKYQMVVAQCTLPVNMLNEKIYIFLWFWFTGVATLEVASICTWAYRLGFRKHRVRSLIRYLKIAEVYVDSMKDRVKQFEAECLRPDGSFLLYMLRLNAGDIITNEILQELLERYINKELEVEEKKTKEALIIASSPNMYGTSEDVSDNSSVKQRLV